jgi:hypothetical protein
LLLKKKFPLHLFAQSFFFFSNFCIHNLVQDCVCVRVVWFHFKAKTFVHYHILFFFSLSFSLTPYCSRSFSSLCYYIKEYMCSCVFYCWKKKSLKSPPLPLSPFFFILLHLNMYKIIAKRFCCVACAL